MIYNNTGGYVEVMAQSNKQATPASASCFLLGTGLLGLSFGIRRTLATIGSSPEGRGFGDTNDPEPRHALAPQRVVRSSLAENRLGAQSLPRACRRVRVPVPEANVGSLAAGAIVGNSNPLLITPHRDLRLPPLLPFS